MASEKVRKTACYFIAADEVMVDGAKLPAGTYSGYSKNLGVHGPGGVLAWMPAEYTLNLTNPEILKTNNFGMIIEIELNADQAVKTGELIVRER